MKFLLRLSTSASFVIYYVRLPETGGKQEAFWLTNIPLEVNPFSCIMVVCLNRVFLLTNIGVFMPLAELNGGCIRCGHDKLSFIYLVYLGLSPCFLTGLCNNSNTSVLECLRKEGGRAEGAYFGLLPCEKCKGTLTSLQWKRFVMHRGLHLCV